MQALLASGVGLYMTFILDIFECTVACTNYGIIPFSCHTHVHVHVRKAGKVWR